MTAAPLPDQMRASVFTAPGRPLELRSFPRPALARGETLVEVICSTLCGSDLHTYLGKRSGPTPSILGHEAVGQIVEFGPGEHPLQRCGERCGEPLSIGDRITWSIAASCGDCFFCQNDLPQKCVRLFKYGHESCYGEHPLSGGMAEFCHLAAGTTILRVPEQLPDVVASSANCATATAAAALRTAGDVRGRTVVIQGAGLLGLTAAAMAHVEQAENVIVADVDPRRLATASRFGAMAVVDVSDGEDALNDVIRQSTHGRGADVIVEMSGAAQAFCQGLSMLRTGGQYILVGAVKPIGSAPLELEQVVRRMWSIRGVHNYAPADLAAAIDFLASNCQRFPFEELVSSVFPLEQADAAFQTMVETSAIRVAVRP
jgi:putative phosphonate catabolism associated alcohol dehydrogenase